MTLTLELLEVMLRQAEEQVVKLQKYIESLKKAKGQEEAESPPG
jgi:hypothetical protein